MWSWIAFGSAIGSSGGVDRTDAGGNASNAAGDSGIGGGASTRGSGRDSGRGGGSGQGFLVKLGNPGCENSDGGVTGRHHLRLQEAAGRRLQTRHQVRPIESAPQRRAEHAEQELGVAEADLRLRRMDVDVDRIGGQIEEQDRDRIPARHQQAAIGFLDGVAQSTVADPPAIEEEILELGGAAVAGGVGDEAVEAGPRILGVDLVEPILDLVAEEQADALDQAGAAGDLVHQFVVVLERQMQVRLGEGDAGHDLADVPHLGGRRAQELAPHRRVPEEMPDLDPGPGRSVPESDRGQFAAMAVNLGSERFAAGPRLERHLGDAADRRQGFAAKSHGADAEEVVRAGELAGGVVGEGEREVGGVDAAAVVDDADRLGAADFDVDIDSGGAGVEAVLEEFLDDAGGPFDHLAGGDLVDHRHRQLANPALRSRHGGGFNSGDDQGSAPSSMIPILRRTAKG